MSWLGWLIIAALLAALILLPPTSFRTRGYPRELASWVGFLLLVTGGSAVVLGLISLALHMIGVAS